MNDKLMTMIKFLDAYIQREGRRYYFEISADIQGVYGSKAQARRALLDMIIDHLNKI